MDRPFAAYKGSEPYIFVSYAHRDDSLVYPELIWLKDSGFNIWYDEGIEAGTEWREELASAIEDASLFLYLVSNASVQSKTCRKEVNFAIDRDIPIIAIHLEKTDLSGGLSLTLSDRQAILKYESLEQEYTAKLLEGIQKYIPGINDISPAPVVAKPSLGKRILRSRSLWVITGLLAVSTILMSVNESRVWITETAIGLAFKAAVIFSSDELEIETGIAVLPFYNMSKDPDNEYFSDGISEEILNALVKANRMNVIARTSSFSFKGKNQDVKEIGRALGVTHILEGSVRKSNDNVRITVQLVDAATGIHLWSETYDRQLLDVFAVQDEIASVVVRQIGIELMSVADTGVIVTSRGTSSREAYELYLQAKHLVRSGNPFEMEESLSLFEQAIALDREYVDAWVELAWTRAGLSLSPYNLYFPDEMQPIAIEAARTALKLDPTNSRAMSILGMLLINQEYKWQEGADLMRQSIALNPLDAQVQVTYGFFLLNTRQPEAESVIETAYRLNPLDSYVTAIRSALLSQLGRTTDAMSLMETILIDNRKNYLINAMAATFANFVGRTNAAEKHLEMVREVVGADYPFVRVMERLIAINKGDVELEKQMRAEIYALAQHTPIPYIVQLAWDKDQIVEIWDIAIKHRYAVVDRLFLPKPYHMPEEDWQRIRVVTKAANADIGSASIGAVRTEAEQQKVLSESVTLTDEDWKLYPGEYEGEERYGGIIRVVRQGNELRGYYPGRGDSEAAVVGRRIIPMGDHIFKRLDFKQTWEFVLVNGEVTEISRVDGQLSVTFKKIK